MRILKTYESFREPFKFEENIIDPILSIIRDHQDYLTQPAYGTYGIKGKSNQNEGKKNLYRHRFFLWLKNNQK